MNRQVLIATVFALTTTSTVVGQTADSAAFIIRLGNDTTAIERYLRTPNQLIAEAIQRSPTTTLHQLRLRFGPNGAITQGEWTVRAPGSMQPTTRRVFQFTGDSAIIETTQGTRTQTQRVAARDAIPIAGPFYAPYELAIMRSIAGASAVSVISGAAPVAIRVQRLGRDSVTLNNQFDEPMRAHVDASGRLLHLKTPAFTTVERLRWIDFEAFAREFAARDQAGKSMGPLSPRMTVRRNINGANIWLDYGRPAARGRPIWGALVPWDRVWRMGANDAAHFSTDRTLELGNLTISPGTYTLFLKPSQSGWELIVNRATGISGLDYDAAVDLGEVPLQVSTVNTPVESFTLDVSPSGERGIISISWDRMVATAGFRVRPR